MSDVSIRLSGSVARPRSCRRLSFAVNVFLLFIESSLSRSRFSGRYDPNDFFFVFIAKGMNYNQDCQILHAANRPKSLLAIEGTVRDSETKRIEEDFLSQFERNAVLSTVLAALPFIPLEAHVLQTNLDGDQKNVNILMYVHRETRLNHPPIQGSSVSMPVSHPRQHRDPQDNPVHGKGRKAALPHPVHEPCHHRPRHKE